MGKNLNHKDLARRSASRSLLVVSLAATLAAFGCSTNQNLGSGTPARSGSELRTAPTSGVTSGQERATPPPMTSSYTRADVLPSLPRRTVSRADRAAAILAGQRAAGGRYLGTVNPALATRSENGGVRASGQFVDPALLTTANASIGSGRRAGIPTGIGVGFVANGTNVVTPAAIATPGFSASAIGTGGVPAPAVAAAPLPVGAFAASQVTPTVSAIGNATVTAVSSAVPLGTNPSLGVTPTTAPVSTFASSAVASGSAVRLVRPSTGNATITNAGTTSVNNPNP